MSVGSPLTAGPSGPPPAGAAVLGRLRSRRLTRWGRGAASSVTISPAAARRRTGRRTEYPHPPILLGCSRGVASPAARTAPHRTTAMVATRPPHRRGRRRPVGPSRHLPRHVGEGHALPGQPRRETYRSGVRVGPRPRLGEPRAAARALAHQAGHVEVPPPAEPVPLAGPELGPGA